jgi:hypothetical protein
VSLGVIMPIERGKSERQPSMTCCQVVHLDVGMQLRNRSFGEFSRLRTLTKHRLAM